MILRIQEISKGGNPQGKKSESPGHKPSCIAFDPQNSDRAYWGIFDNGLWKTDDRGQSWDNVGKDSFSPAHESCPLRLVLLNGDRLNKVYAGTEPSALYVSNDGGDSWEKMKALNDLPSSITWTFHRDHIFITFVGLNQMQPILIIYLSL